MCPKAEFVFGLAGPSIRSSKKVPATRSPTLKRVTPSLTSTTSPAPSEARAVSELTGLPMYLPEITARSLKFKEAAFILTSTCPGPNIGFEIF